jgi:hypothetical protein
MSSDGEQTLWSGKSRRIFGAKFLPFLEREIQDICSNSVEHLCPREQTEYLLTTAAQQIGLFRSVRIILEWHFAALVTNISRRLVCPLPRGHGSLAGGHAEVGYHRPWRAKNLVHLLND